MVRGDDKLARAVQAVHDQWRSGQLSVAQASLRLEALREANPNPVLSGIFLDVAEEQFWSFPMALAWIVWRTNERVQDYWGPYRQTLREWTFDKFYTHNWSDAPAQLLSLGFPTRLAVLPDFWDEAGEQAALCSLEQAEAKLWRKLQAGDLTATGVCQLEKRRTDIRSIEFIDLTLKTSYSLIQLEGRSNFDVRRYDDPLIERKAVVQHWKQNFVAAASSANLQRRCYDLLMELMDREPRSPKPKPELQRDFQRDLGITGLAFKRAWKEADLRHDRKWSSQRRPLKKNRSHQKSDEQ